jgi:hypothetical protein
MTLIAQPTSASLALTCGATRLCRFSAVTTTMLVILAAGFLATTPVQAAPGDPDASFGVGPLFIEFAWSR